jgi:hypothetical protein
LSPSPTLLIITSGSIRLWSESTQFTSIKEIEEVIKEIEEEICHIFTSIAKVHEIDHKSNTLHRIHRERADDEGRSTHAATEGGKHRLVMTPAPTTTGACPGRTPAAATVDDWRDTAAATVSLSLSSMRGE